MKLPFPFNYFSSILPPRKTIQNSDVLNWLEIVVVYVVMNALLFFPLCMAVYRDYFKDPSAENTGTLVAVRLVFILMVVGSTTLILLLGSSAIIYLTRKSGYLKMTTFKQCLNYALNASGAGALLAFLVGFWTMEPISIISVYSLIFVFMVLISVMRQLTMGIKDERALAKLEHQKDLE
jgi:maltodextrin utilization protein YvdJ